MDAVSMLKMVVSDYFPISSGYGSNDPAEPIVDRVVMENLLSEFSEAIKIYVGDKLFGEHPKQSSMAMRERQARKVALVHLWRRLILMLSDSSINASASRFLAHYSRIVRRYGGHALMLGSLTAQYTAATGNSSRVRVRRTVRELGLPSEASDEEREARVVALFERAGIARY